MPQAAFGGLRCTIYTFKLETYDWPSLVSTRDCPQTARAVRRTYQSDYRPFAREHRSRTEADANAGSDRGDRPPDLRAPRVVGAVRPQTARPGGRGHRIGGRAGQHDLRDRQSRVPSRHRGGIRRALSKGRPRLRRRGARRAKAARSQLGADRSYVWSRLHGNYSGLSESDENGRTEPNIGGTFDRALALFDGSGRALYGRLATDRPHQVKAQFVYTAPLA